MSDHTPTIRGAGSALPNVVFAGPMKAGTTWVHNYLERRGDVCLPSGVKETFFFDRNADKSIEWYQAHFKHYRPETHRMVVEVGASYFPEGDAPLRVNEMLQRPTLAFMLRDPVRRAWSHYNHVLRMGYTQLPLREAVVKMPAILNASRYQRMLDRWSDACPGSNTLLFSFEMLRDQPDQFVAMLDRSLDLPPMQLSLDDLDKNTAATSRSVMLARTARHIANRLRAQRLYPLVNFAKKIGAKQLVFGRAGKGAQVLGDTDRAFLETELADEIRAFPELLAFKPKAIDAQTPRSSPVNGA